MRDPVFIIGPERSGTNLLRLILNSHSSITVPHPPHIMKFFHPIEKIYGDLNDDKNFRKLINDVCRLVELHTYPWGINPDRKKTFARVKDRTLISINFELYNQYREYAGKKRWVCKSTFMIHHVAEILKYFPNARFLYMFAMAGMLHIQRNRQSLIIIIFFTLPTFGVRNNRPDCRG